MTTVDVRTAQEVRPARVEPRLTLGGVLRSELGKLTSLRSVRVAALCVPPVVAGGAVLHAFVYAHTLGPVPVPVPAQVAWEDVLRGGMQAGELAGAVLAALAVGSEYTGRVALTTFVAAPRRLLVAVAKVVALLVPLAVLVALGLLVGTVLSVPLVTATAVAGPSLDLAGTALADVGAVLACAFLALAVTALGRSTAAGITVALAVLLVLPVAVPLLGPALGVDLGPFLLTYAAPMAAALHDPAGPGALLRDLAVTATWLVVPGAVAAVALVRRDV